MKKTILLMLLASIAIVGCANESNKTKEPDKTETVISKGLKFCEGSVAYGSSLLVTNFGSSELNPLNTEGMGYVMQIKDNNAEMFIPKDGNLSAPKGMAIDNDYLYIADVGKVVVYNLKNKSAAPQTVRMPEGEAYVNDIAISGKSAYISVTNTGKIFKLDITTPDRLDATMLSQYATVVGANGLLIKDNSLYIASYPADGNTTVDNVIYVIKDIKTPVVEKFITRQGQYDGVAISDGKLYFSSWVDGEIGYVDMKTKDVKLLKIGATKLKGPADITILKDVLYIPDLPSSAVVAVKL